VPLNRLLKYLNLLIAVVLVVALGLVYWFVYRVLPQTSGRVIAPMQQRTTVTRDGRGIPHIEAQTLEDALFVQGYVTAQDRLWQMDVLRRLGSGELSEVIGSATIDMDRESRRLRLRRVAEEHYRALAPQLRSSFAAYARGVNHFISTHRSSLPAEFTLMRYDPQPWSVVDSLVVGMQMFRTLTTSWREELQKRSMLEGGEADKVDVLFSPRSGYELQPGSNAWVISGKRTASGKPILANDPHLEFSLPSTWYQVHLKMPGMNVTGVSLPGIPGVIIGHNDRIAWGVTNLQFDVQDLYSEKMNGQTAQYLFKGQPQQARLEREVIRVKGGRAVEFDGFVTRHGPVVQASGSEFLALRWVGEEPGSFGFPFLDINRARNWNDFLNALRPYPGPAQNFVYSDVDGNIGYHVAGSLPIRRNYNGDIPVDGSSGQFEWDGYIPFDELPQIFNPPSGIIATANQNPFPAAYPYNVRGNFASGYRNRQIVSLLSSRTGWKPDDMLVVQKDVYSALSSFIAKQVVAAYEKRGAQNAGLTDAVQMLKSWNGQMEKGTPAPFLSVLLYQHLRRAIAERASPGKGGIYDSMMAGPVIERLLRERPASWFTDYDQLLLRALVDALEEGKRIQGRNAAKWDYGEYLQLDLPHPVGKQIPWVGSYLGIGPVPMSGSSTTVKQTSRKLGPSMRMAVDLGNLENSYQNITIGESGQFLSSHYKDQWDAYYAGRSFPMRFGKYDGDVLAFVPE
jgi:penicillin amidase